MESFTDLLLSLCAFCVFGGVFANAGMIVYLVLFSARPKHAAIAAPQARGANVALADAAS